MCTFYEMLMAGSGARNCTSLYEGGPLKGVFGALLFERNCSEEPLSPIKMHFRLLQSK